MQGLNTRVEDPWVSRYHMRRRFREQYVERCSAEVNKLSSCSLWGTNVNKGWGQNFVEWKHSFFQTTVKPSGLVHQTDSYLSFPGDGVVVLLRSLLLCGISADDLWEFGHGLNELRGGTAAIAFAAPHKLRMDLGGICRRRRGCRRRDEDLRMRAGYESGAQQLWRFCLRQIYSLDIKCRKQTKMYVF